MSGRGDLGQTSSSRLDNTRSSLVSSCGLNSVGRLPGNDRRSAVGPNTGAGVASYNAVVAEHFQGPDGKGNHLDIDRGVRGNEWTQRMHND